jgi:selenocysteine lyase/cysteine desulfurase
VVIDAIAKYYQEINANIHRGVHISWLQMHTKFHVVKSKNEAAQCENAQKTPTTFFVTV